jgi:hypothetical protein
MRLLGLPQDKIEDRLKKVKLHNANEEKQNAEQERAEFGSKTQNFVEFLFEKFGLKEVILPGTENASIINDIRNLDDLNYYITRLSEFITTKTSYFADDR